MSAHATALTVIFAIVFVGSAIGFVAGTRRKMTLEQWTVGGRGFGALLIWLLMAGEIYTVFSFLGVSGWAYSRGAPALYILAYLCLGNVVAFFVLPPVWELGRRHGLQTISDFFQMQYRSKSLAGFVAAVGVAFLIPYLQIQLTGLGIIVEIASFGGVGRTTAMVIAMVLIAGFVLVSGIRAVAWVSVLKDFLMILAIGMIGVWVPRLFFGGIGPMFAELARVNPDHLVMPGATKNLGHSWFITTVILTSLGGCVWPHLFGASFSAKSADALRRNAVVMPLYSISLACVFFAGLAAVLVVPHLSNPDLSLLTVVREAFPPWLLGVIGGAGALAAMVPAAVIVLAASTLFAKNLVRPLIAPGMADEQVGRLARATVVALSLISLYFAIYSSTSLVSLLLVGFAGVTQFFPGVMLGLFWKRVTLAGVFGGMVLGVGGTAFLILTDHDPIGGLSAGFVALCANFAFTVAASALAPAKSVTFAGTPASPE